eukprot:g16263.t1
MQTVSMMEVAWVPKERSAGLERPTGAYYSYCHDHLRRWKQFDLPACTKEVTADARPEASRLWASPAPGHGHSRLDRPWPAQDGRPRPGAVQDASNFSPQTPRQMSGRTALKRIEEALRKRGASSLADLPTPPKSRLRLEATDVAHGAGADGADRKDWAAVSLQAERFSCRATAESSQVATLVLVASAGLAGRALRELRHRRKLLQAQGRLVEPPLPPYMQPKADTQGEALVRREKMNLALATAEGTISAASAACSNLATLDQDWVPPTKVDSALAIRALLRYGELRHSPGDDLTPKDLSGRSGAGIRALLRICRSYKFEVAAELEFHGDQSMQMIKAFHDQANMISKFMPFFRTTIEKSIPSLLRQQVEPLPRVISYLEPYGEIQLSVLYEAAKDQVIKAQIEQFDPRSLLEVTEKWVSKARSGEIGVIMAHKARVLVRHVVSLDLDMAPSKKAAWMGLALWGSVLEPSDDVVLMEDRLRKGAFFRSQLRCQSRQVKTGPFALLRW